MSPSDQVIHLILNTDGVIHFDTENYIEVRPGRKSPIHINFKNTLSHSHVRESIASLLAERMKSDNIAYVCGMESGGSYFASRCSDILGAPLSLYRKDEKQHAEKGRMVGANPKQGSPIAIIDDTLVSGKTVQPVVDYMRGFTDNIHIYVILSYGLDAEIKKWLDVKITPIAQVAELVRIGKEQGFFSSNDEQHIHAFINNQIKERESA